MSFLHLEYFVCTVRLGSVEKAAQHLYLSTQSISKAIRTLENESQTRLIIKGRGEVALTPEGQLFYLEAEKTIAAYEKTNHLKQTLKESRITEEPLGKGPIRMDRTNTDTALSRSACADREAPLHHRAHAIRHRKS